MTPICLNKGNPRTKGALMNGQRFINCRRCGSAMIFKKFFDYGGHSWGWECVFCKEVIDYTPEVDRPAKEDWKGREGRNGAESR